MKTRNELLWKVLDLFETRVRGWGHSLAVWRTSKTDRYRGDRTELIASLGAGLRDQGIATRAMVDLRCPGAHSTPRIRTIVAEIERRLRARRYAIAGRPLPEQPLLAVREIVEQRLRDEHLFLSGLTGRSVKPLRGRISSMRLFSIAVSASGAAWTLHAAEWKLVRPIRAAGRPVDAIFQMRICPRVRGGRGLTASFWVHVQLPWNGRGVRPRWAKDARAKLSRQLRAGGLRVQWYAAKAWPAAEAALSAYGRSVRSAGGAEREANRLSSLRLGDEA